MSGRSYRPRPANGSGDSPRPPFLSEFVNHIGKLTLVEVVYHLFGAPLATRVHPHVERSIRLKTKSAHRIVKLQTAHSDVGQQAVGYRASSFGQARKRRPPQLAARPTPRLRCAEAFCDCVTVPAQPHRSVDIGPATPHF